QSVTFGDYDGDGYLDIHTTDWGNDISLSTSRLLHNLGAVNPGHFEDVTAAAGLDVYRPSHFYNGDTDTNTYRHSSTFTDIDRDGHPDLVIASDFRTSQIFWNNGDGTFTDGTSAAGVGSDEDGMGTTVGDFDGDGRLDWFISCLVDVPGETQDHSGNRLFRNNGDRTFADHTDVGGVRDSGWSWGTTFLDHDNDRDLDLFVTNGWNPGLQFPDQSHIYQNDNGVFTDVSAAAGVTDTGQGRGLLSFDYDNDGDLDVFIVNHGDRPILYRNDGDNENDWLKIRVEGTASNRDGIGALITLDPDANVAGDEIVREINAGSNYLSQNELTAHYGLGPNAGTIALITVVWPSGAVQALSNVSANQVLNLVESVMPGDYNGDSKVDSADYAIWRKTGINGQQGYNVWRTNFGAMSQPGSGAGSSAAVPEPSGVTMLTLALGLLCSHSVRKRNGSRPPGPLGWDPPTTFARITDGASKTLLVSEKRVPPYSYDAGGHGADDCGWGDGWDYDTMRASWFPIGRDVSIPESGLSSNDYGFCLGSGHSAGIHGLFGDGSARGISYDVDRLTLNRLGTRDDGEVIDESKL
ncbi:MAG TPA: CRTAC1 family protein, partial [Lacipirellulaceae bacterium]|nr:CRTAC1 family protein [Lacipirellulaceae bacterium]